MKTPQLLWLAVHAIVLSAILICIWQSYQARAERTEQLRRVATTECGTTNRLRHQVQCEEAQLEGLQQQDPYVIEKIARERYRWVGLQSHGILEVSPPPLPKPKVQP